MPSNGQNGTVSRGAIWVALIGAIASSGGYLVAYFQELSLQKMNQRHDLVIRLLRDDPSESSRNLEWAHKLDLIELSDSALEELNKERFLGPVGVEPQRVPGSLREEVTPSDDVVRLVDSLDGLVKSERSIALQILLDKLKISQNEVVEGIVNASLAALSGERLERLTPNGRYNILYLLSRIEWKGMSDSARKQTREALTNILDRANEGIAAVGPQTRGLIDNIKQALDAADQ